MCFLIITCTILFVTCDRSNTYVQKEQTVKYYRIKQVDKDGNVTYSKIVQIKK